MKKLISNWYLVIVIGFIVFAGLVFAICGESSIIAVHDNLDLFIPQFQMMKDTQTFFAHGVDVPFLGGISRDVLPAEFSLYTMLYMILPAYPAYIVGYLLKIIIAIFSCVLLAKDFCGEKYSKYNPLVYLSGLAYGVLNVFPTFGIPFASIPLVIYLVRKIYKKPAVKWYVALFFYPLLSYFSYFGLFILAYMVLAFIWLWIKDKKFPARLLIAIVVLSVGSIACEYRLFATMLLDDHVTIRSTIEAGSYTLGGIAWTIGEVFIKGMFHAESMHTFLILPVCIIYFIYLNVTYIKNKNVKGIFHDFYNLLMLVLVFNSVVYGIYYWEPFRNLVETICPPLTGWQFNRTVFFSPFIRLYDKGTKLFKGAANLLAVAAVLVIVLSGSRYNDLYNTCFSKVYNVVKGKPTEQLSFEEFYSKELFEEAKEDIGYCGQWSVAYGLYPAVLEYNGISTLDGYLGFYSQIYKDSFRKIIAPALDRVEVSREYFDSWGARAYLYSGTDLSIVSPTRSQWVTDRDIYIDVDAFKNLGGRYIFSSIELTNAEQSGLLLVGTYTNENSPYTLYVYQTASRYQSKERENLTFEEMKSLTYDEEKLEEQIETLKQLAEEAQESDAALYPERVKEVYADLEEELTRLVTCYSIAQIVYYQDVFSEENRLWKEELLEVAIDTQDEALVALREVCKSPYREAMEEIIDPALVDLYAKYEEITDREKEIALKENSLEQEYDQAAEEEYYITYNGEEWSFERFTNEGEFLAREDAIAIYQALYKEKNSVLGEIFLELVALRNEEAELAGYDNYAEYAYEEQYVRDYSLEDVEDLFKAIKKDVVPVVRDMNDFVYDQDYYSILWASDNHTGDDLLEKISPYLEEIDPELLETMDHMISCELYDLDEATGKASVGFTLGLSYYNDAFVFISPYGNYYDYSQTIHEFGHYNQSYRNTEDIMEQQTNIDVCEIHSQGLEMLYSGYMADILEDEELGDVISYMQVYNMTTTITNAALVSEFEIEAYKNPDMTLQELGRLYLKLSTKYGTYYTQEIKELYTWSDISHMFSSPCYYISYLTSAFSSLDILAMSEEDRHEAVETYMEITTLPTYVPYCSAVEYVGLRDIFEDGVPKEIMKDTVRILEEN